MRQIRGLQVRDKYVRMIIDIGDACMMTLIGKNKEGLSLLNEVLQLNQEELQSADSRNLYEEIQRRRGFALTNLERYAEAVPVLKEATSFATALPEDMQSIYLYLGICYAALSEADLAKEAYLRAIGFGLGDESEADARERLAVVYYMSRAFAQAKHHLEAALQLPEKAINAQLRKRIYQRMSRVCHYLGQTEEEQKYSQLAKAS
jgi:tetratricopeptide (TPR) repeat protein